METALAHRSFVALTPQEVPGVQLGIADWCRDKIVALSHELREQRQNLREAKRMLWRYHGWTTAIARTKKRMVYYAKIQAAVRAGYLIVPNFESEIIACRVGKETPNEGVDVHATAPDLLPQGQGRYVDDRLEGYDQRRTWKDSNNQEHACTDFHPTRYGKEIDFPVTIVKPAILDATARAMALKIFDRIGVVRGGRRSDPIVIGEIIDPSAPKSSRRWSNAPKRVSFFIAWWLNTEDL